MNFKNSITITLLFAITSASNAQFPDCEGRELNLPLSQPISNFDHNTPINKIEFNKNTWCQFGFDYLYYGDFDEDRFRISNLTGSAPPRVPHYLFKLDEIRLIDGKIFFWGPMRFRYTGCDPVLLSSSEFSCDIYGQ